MNSWQTVKEKIVSSKIEMVSPGTGKLLQSSMKLLEEIKAMNLNSNFN